MTLQPDELIETCSVRGRPVTLCPNQRAYVMSTAKMESIVKSRATGFSLMGGARMFARAMLRDNYRGVITSWRERSAYDVLDYIRELYHSAPVALRRPLKTDNAHVVEWKDGRGTARIEVRAAASLRGVHGSDLLVDEAAHLDLDALIAQAGPALVHAGQLSLVSSPLGRDTRFGSICLDRAKNARWRVQRVPWWQSPFLATNPAAATAWIRQHPHSTIEERLDRFGTQALIDVWDALGHDAWLFDQECQCVHHDHAALFFSVADIRACEQDYEIASHWHGLPRPTGLVYGGVDVGRTKDATEIVLGELDPATGVWRLLMRTTMRDTLIHEQQSWLQSMMANFPVHKLVIDGANHGRQLAEHLMQDYRGRVEMFIANMHTKEAKYLALRERFRERKIVVPRMRDIAVQLCSIRREITSSGNVVIKLPRKEGSHCDLASALAMGAPPLRAEADDGLGTVHFKVIGSEDPERYRDWNDDGRIKKLARGYLDKSDQAIRFLLSPESSHARGDSDDDKARRLALHLVLDWREQHDLALKAWKEENARRRAAAEGRGPLPEPPPPWEVADDPARVEQLYEEFKKPTLNDYGIGTEAADIGQLLLGPRYDGRW